jgi:hypothetical protein
VLLYGLIVSQATPQIDQFVAWLQGSSISIVGAQPLKRVKQWRDRLKPSWRLLLSLAVLGLLVLWNISLVLALGSGLALAIWVYLTRLGWWQLPQREIWQKLWSQPHRSLSLAVVSGGVTVVGCYVGLGIWQESQHSWLALGVIMEGLVTAAILLLLIWQQWVQRLGQAAQFSDRHLTLLEDLAAADPLKRLIAVRRLTQQAAHPLPLEAAHLADCFRLMLNRETEPLVCSALLDGLHHLNPRLNSGSQQGSKALSSRMGTGDRPNA